MPVAFWRWGSQSQSAIPSRGPVVVRTGLSIMTNSPSTRRRPSVHITLQRRSTASSPGLVSGRDPSDKGHNSLAPEHRFADVLPRTRIAQAVRCQGAAQEQAVHAHGDGQAGRGPTAVSRSSAQFCRDGRACGLPMRRGEAPGGSAGHRHQPARAGEETPVVGRQKKVEPEEGKFCVRYYLV